MRYIIRVISTTLFFLLNVFCNEVSVKQGENITPRDTTITAANAFSQLFFDSLNLEHFLEKEVSGDSIGKLHAQFL